VSKHDRAKQEKLDRNAKYADKYRQLVCKNEKCRHRTCRPKPGRRCPICNEKDMKPRRR